MAALGWLLNLDFAAGATETTKVGPLDRPMQRVATALIGGVFGDAITLTYNAAGTYSTTTGTATPTTSAVSVKAMVETYAVDELNDFVERRDLRVTIPAVGLTVPKPDDTVTIGGDVYQVVSVRSGYADFLAATYTLQVRR